MRVHFGTLPGVGFAHYCPWVVGPGEASRGTGLLVASSGGHLLQLVHLQRQLPDADWLWIAFNTEDARHLLRAEKVIHAFHPTNRNLPNLLRNVRLAFAVVRRVRPRVVITTGAGVAVPFCWIGRLYGARIVYIESFARTTEASLTARLVHPVAHRFFVQWPGLVGRFRKAEYLGSLF